MSEESSTWTPLTPAGRADQVFPTVTADQIARVAAHGHRRIVQAGEVLVEAGDSNVPCFVVISGRLDIVRRDGATERLVRVSTGTTFSREGRARPCPLPLRLRVLFRALRAIAALDV